LLDRFNAEFDEPTPGPVWLAGRVRSLIESGDLTVLLAGDGPDGVAVLRFRPALWKDAPDADLEELYVVPVGRGHGLGRALMDAAIELARERGAGDMHLGTSEDDTAALDLYESLGFGNRKGGREGPVQYFYEREL
jgi:GNAT superfamily N-acetyltransferase